MTQLLLQKERQDRIRQAGAGMDPLVAAVARATQGMRESVGDVAGGIGGLLTGEGRRLDPRMAAAVKLDKDRDEMMQLLSGFAADGNITEEEAKLGYTELVKRGYMNEAKEFLQQAASMGTMRRADTAEKRAERGLVIQEQGLDLRKKSDARAAATAELERKKAEAEAETRPLRKKQLELQNKKLEKQIELMGTGGDKYSELRESEKKAVKKYITDNPDITKAFDSRFKDNAGSTFGKPNEENIRAVVEAMAKLRTQKAYKSKSTLELLKIVLGSSQAPAARTGGGRTLSKPPTIGAARPAAMPQGSFSTSTGGINSPMPKP
jgi:hypothetical protein